MTLSTKDKWHVIIPGATLLGLYLIFYNLIGNTSAALGISYSHIVVTALDHQIPLIPAFVIFYLFTVIYPLICIIYLLNKGNIKLQSFYRIYFTTLLMIVFCAAIWLLLPVQFTLRASEQVLASDGFFGMLVSNAYKAITGWNACPSFHIAISWYLFRMMKLYLRQNLWVFQALFIAIAASTLFIRIHYIADVIFGILVAELAVSLILKNLEKHHVFATLTRKNFIYSYVGIVVGLTTIYALFLSQVNWLPK